MFNLGVGGWRLVVAGAVLSLPALVQAQDATPPPEPRVSVSGYVQPRYDVHTELGETTDRVFLRRAIVAVQGQLAGPWQAELAAGRRARGFERRPGCSSKMRLCVTPAGYREA